MGLLSYDELSGFGQDYTGVVPRSIPRYSSYREYQNAPGGGRVTSPGEALISYRAASKSAEQARKTTALNRLKSRRQQQLASVSAARARARQELIEKYMRQREERRATDRSREAAPGYVRATATTKVRPRTGYATRSGSAAPRSTLMVKPAAHDQPIAPASQGSQPWYAGAPSSSGANRALAYIASIFRSAPASIR